MPIIKSAKKAARQATKRTASNVGIKKNIRLALKEFKKSPTAKNASKIQSEYDKAVKKGLLKKNTASRRKAQVAKFAKAANVKPAAAVKKPTTTKKPVATPAKAPAKKPVAAKKPATTVKKTTPAKKPAKPTASKKPSTTKKTA